MEHVHKPVNPKTNPLLILAGVMLILLFFDCLFLMLFQSEVGSYQLIQKEMEILDQDRRIIDASKEISLKYKDEIDTISGVFPTERTFPLFIQVLENELKSNVDEYQLKFSSNPITEGDKLFLLFSISVKADLAKLSSFLLSLEKLPYMTHITAITAKSPGGITNKSEYIIGMKVYVQNPFITK
jgi:hypothetical protein